MRSLRPLKPRRRLQYTRVEKKKGGFARREAKGGRDELKSRLIDIDWKKLPAALRRRTEEKETRSRRRGTKEARWRKGEDERPADGHRARSDFAN